MKIDAQLAAVVATTPTGKLDLQVLLEKVRTLETVLNGMAIMNRQAYLNAARHVLKTGEPCDSAVMQRMKNELESTLRRQSGQMKEAKVELKADLNDAPQVQRGRSR